MNNFTETIKKYWWVLLVIVLIIIIIVRMGGAKKVEGPNLDSIQAQIENEPKLKENIDSPRNNFKGGSYSLSGASTFMIEYDGKKMTVPVTSGAMNVLDKGRVRDFNITANLSKSADKAVLETALGISKNPNVKIQALTILPNTTDEAFTIAYSMNILGKDFSFATGMFVNKTEKGIAVTGDINIDKALSGLTSTMKITPNFIFE